MRVSVVFAALFALVVSAVAGAADAAPASPAKWRILCSTFPIYQIVRNVADGASATVDLMIPAAFGCPHDYALTPSDMAKLTSADILVVNGLGMEAFLAAPLRRARPNLRVIDSSAGIRDLLAMDPGLHGHDEADEDGYDDNGDDDDPDLADASENPFRPVGMNPHLFVSPLMSAKLAGNIAEELSRLDPAGGAVYMANAARYADAMHALTDDMRRMIAGVANRRIVETHGAFDYLARDLGLEIVGMLRPHDEEPSAAEMLALTAIIKAKKPVAILVEPQYPTKSAEALSRETGVPIYPLDPAANGPDNAPLDYFAAVMRQNLTTLVKALGNGNGK